MTHATGARTHALFDSHGTVYACGSGDAGELGEGSTTNSALPDKVDLAGPVIEVSQGGGANNGQTIAVLRNGSVWAWGNNNRGQLGVGSLVDSHVPVPVAMPNKTTVIKVNSGGYASYAIDSTGRLWAWGDNNSGQLGAGHATLLANAAARRWDPSQPSVIDGTKRRRSG